MATNRVLRKVSVLVSTAMLACTLAVYTGEGRADEAPSIAELENGFWVCDYVATTRGIYATPVEMCSTIMDELLTRKFGGDYEGLLGWWRENKIVQHQTLEAAIGN